ncbi:MAG TPA: hypothetical protein DCG49_02660 [Ruminococcus sp.]|nr:hypothetical protein [Ruminococcus sp.]
MKHSFNLKRSIRSVWLICGAFILCEACCIWRIVPSGHVFPNREIRTNFSPYAKELLSFQTFAEEKIGKEIMQRAKTCMDYTGAAEHAPDAGALSRFYWFQYCKQPDSVDSSVRFHKTMIRGTSGGVWMTYSLQRYDENGDLINDCQECLVRCEIRKDDSGFWNVTDIYEMP